MALGDLGFSSAFDAAATPLALPVWLAGTVAAVFVFVSVLAFRRAGPLNAMMRVVVLAIGVLALLAFFDQSARRERIESRRILEARSAALTARALAPGSALACLGGAAGEAIETACEKKIFASPESAAAAVSFVTAQLSLLVEASAERDGSDPGLTATLAGLRRVIALDRYGIAAHVLATRDGCTAEQCPVFALLHEASALKTNLKTGAFDNYVARYAATWSRPGEAQTPVAENQVPATPAPAAGPGALPPSGHRPVSSKYDFPSADSIPAVSIMNAEPKLPAASDPNAAPARTTNGAPTPKTAAAAAEPAKPPLPRRRPEGDAAAPAQSQ